MSIPDRRYLSFFGLVGDGGYGCLLSVPEEGGVLGVISVGLGGAAWDSEIPKDMLIFGRLSRALIGQLAVICNSGMRNLSSRRSQLSVTWIRLKKVGGGN